MKARPWTLITAAAITAAEALTMLVWTVLVLVAVSTMSLTSALFFLAVAVGLGLCAWGLWTLQSWSRAPVVMVQLVTLGLAWNAIHVNWPVSLVLAVVAVATLAGVFAPRSLNALAAN